METKYVAQFEYCSQVGPDDFATETHTMICTPETTLYEIHDWQIKRTRDKDKELYALITQASNLKEEE